jgi:predicted transcriptional regulator
MAKRGVEEWVNQPKINRILLSFSVPQTPRYVESKLGIKKLKMRPFLKKGLIRGLNSGARKGKLFVLTRKSRNLLKLTSPKKAKDTNWSLLGWIMASPRQRMVVLKAMDTNKRTSEELRLRGSRYNINLTRISTKEILKELLSKGLIETELVNRKRYCWMSDKGMYLVKDMF